MKWGYESKIVAHLCSKRKYFDPPRKQKITIMISYGVVVTVLETPFLKRKQSRTALSCSDRKTVK